MTNSFLVWVDDLVIAGISRTAIMNLKFSIESKSIMDDRGELECFLGMIILRTERGII